MALVIIKESTTIKDEQTQKEALQFTIGRQIGMHTDCAVRVVIPADANDHLWLADVHMSLPTLDLFPNDIAKNTDLNWFRRHRQEELLKLLWRIHSKICAGDYSPEDGFNHLIHDYPPSNQVIEPMQEEDSAAACRKAVTLLRVRNPEDIRSDIDELRKRLFKEQKHWVVIPPIAQ